MCGWADGEGLAAAVKGDWAAGEGLDAAVTLGGGSLISLVAAPTRRMLQFQTQVHENMTMHQSNVLL